MKLSGRPSHYPNAVNTALRSHPKTDCLSKDDFVCAIISAPFLNINTNLSYFKISYKSHNRFATPVSQIKKNPLSKGFFYYVQFVLYQHSAVYIVYEILVNIIFSVGKTGINALGISHNGTGCIEAYKSRIGFS